MSGRRQQGVPEGSRRCSRCKEIFPETAEVFSRVSGNRAGLGYECKRCNRERQAERRAAARAKRAKRLPPEMSDAEFKRRLTAAMYRERILREEDRDRPWRIGFETRDERIARQALEARAGLREAGVRL